MGSVCEARLNGKMIYKTREVQVRVWWQHASLISDEELLNRASKFLILLGTVGKHESLAHLARAVSHTLLGATVEIMDGPFGVVYYPEWP